MRQIDTIVVHGAWTKPDLDVGVAEIRQWHIQRGFNDIGYHYVIRRNGTIEAGRPVDVVGAHVKNHNTGTVGICLVGGRERVTPAFHTDGLPEEAVQELVWEFNYTRAQMHSLGGLIDTVSAEHPIRDVCGHRDYPGVVKRCPGFDVRSYFG